MKKNSKASVTVDPQTAAKEIVYSVWRDIDWESVSPSRRMKIYDEFTAKVKSAACQPTLSKFLERLCSKMGVKSLSSTSILANFTGEEDILTALREETQYIILLMRAEIEEKQERIKSEKEEAKMEKTLTFWGIKGSKE